MAPLQEQVDRLPDGEYDVVVDTELVDGSLTYGELVLPGEEAGEVLVSAHVCHPAQANDNLSWIAVALALGMAAVGLAVLLAPANRRPGAARRATAAVLVVTAALSGAVARRLLEQVRDGGLQHGVVPQSFASLLSARELEVLLLLDQHLATEEIAKRLFISEHTVRSHVKNLLAKLGVSSRREALERLAAARG